ncbi:hemerythrin domain-containing protein [Schlegelella sp. S2-27]|uniref:Hemerythrin domain-containing protein n=1 Tax=Caldimonas mangrovi TaxID=2944811 RepID=A0ABT0YHP3_9BURK|nr:hemerythrin domain-containing protein [Caldimonas mangrovi]MCM5678249.1 hemerythrin domain-containing protein [Caldimonas mangrovi]
MSHHPQVRDEPSSRAIPVQAQRVRSPTDDTDALVVLRGYQDALLRLFVDLDDIGSAVDQGALLPDRKARLVGELLRELNLLIQIEDEVFYPAVREAVRNDALMNVLDVEHQVAMQIVMEIDDMEPDDELYNAHLDVLDTNVRRHIEQEQSVLFDMIRRSKLGAEQLGRKMVAMRAALLFNDDAIPHANRLPAR